MANLLNKNLRVNGVNQDTQFVKQSCFLIDSSEHPEVLTPNEHHFLCSFAKHEVCIGMKMIVLDVDSSISGDAAATAEFSIHFEGEGGTSAIEPAVEAFSKSRIGYVYDVPLDGVKGYKEGKHFSLLLKIDKTGLKKLKFLVFVDTIPVEDFLTLG